uniref:Transposase n=1 Tax=Arundo donax TaxID=35708 RepID=A0A0A9FM04_ARUDO
MKVKGDYFHALLSTKHETKNLSRKC